MTTLETRIAEVLAAHDFRIKEEVGAHVGVKTIVCNCGNRYGLGESHRAHQAAALAPVIREAQSQAWERARAEIRGIPCWYESETKNGFDLWTDAAGNASEVGARVAVMEALNTNPYRSNDE